MSISNFTSHGEHAKRQYYGPKTKILEKKDVDQAFLKETFSYDPATGVFIKKPWVGSRGRITNEFVYARSSSNKYIKINIGGRLYAAHRLAFVYMLGFYPELQVDHIDGDGGNNKWENLRLVTHKENAQHNVNGNANNTSGLRGVYKCRNKWRSSITVNGLQKSLGVFDTKEEAHSAYISAKKKMHFQ